jgi:hypothetical protein
MVDWCKEMVDVRSESQREELVEAILSSDRIFLASDNWLAVRFVVMNLTQLGLQAYVAGEATAPAIEKGDLVIVISGPRRLSEPYDIISTAKNFGASVALLTHRIPSVRIRDISDVVVVLGSGLNEAAELFIEKLVTAVTISLRNGVPVGKLIYNDANDTYIIHGAGNEIWHAWDQFHFAHNKLNGDGSITARIDSVEPLDDWTVAGLMIRETTASDSAYAAILITPENRVCLYYRSKASGNTDSIETNQDAITLPHWIKLSREGNIFKAQHSEDGKKWKAVKDGSTVVEMEMDDPVHVGLAVCSEAGPAIAAEAKISQVSLGGNWSPGGKFSRSEDIGYEAWGKPEEVDR